ncbi:MAG: adenylate/guanylate cyclase domain-containing protein, partial [Candidatus Entotheonellia bacterium]
MTFEEIVDRALAMLQRRGRVTYRALKLQFMLDDERLEALKNELLYAHPQVVDDEGRGLIWTGANVSDPAFAAVSTGVSPHTPRADTPRPRDESLLASHRVVHSAVMRLYADLVSALLQREGRISYRTLTQLFGFDEACLDHVRQELVFKQLARDVHGEGLEWTGGLPRVVVTDGQPTEPTDGTVEIASAPSDEVPVLPAAPVRPAPEAERRQLTVLFCDLVGSTQLSGQLDPEDLRAVVRAYQETAAEVIQPYAGHIAQYLGDGLLVYVGYPTAHEDDPRRAVHTGLGLVQAIAALNTRLAAQDGVQLAVRVGIHTGPVVVGVMGGGERHEHLALGDTPNLAARLQALAPANAVVISAVTARLVQGSFTLEDLGTHALPGVAEPMAVSRVCGLLATPSHDEEFVTAGGPLLVGRDEEVGLLRRRWDQSTAGHGQVVLLSGEAGIGKSALVEGLRAQVRAEGLPRMAVRCSPYHTNSALYPVITHLEHLWQFEPDDLPETRLAKLEAGLRPYNLPLAEVVPLLAGLLAVPLPTERSAALTVTPPQQKQQTLDALVAWLAAEAERQPVLVAWEDLHWADPTTLEALGLVVEQAPTVPML